MMQGQENGTIERTTLSKWKGWVSVTQVEKVVLALNMWILSSETGEKAEYRALLLTDGFGNWWSVSCDCLYFLIKIVINAIFWKKEALFVWGEERTRKYSSQTVWGWMDSLEIEEYKSTLKLVSLNSSVFSSSHIQLLSCRHRTEWKLALIKFPFFFFQIKQTNGGR